MNLLLNQQAQGLNVGIPKFFIVQRCQVNSLHCFSCRVSFAMLHSILNPISPNVNLSDAWQSYFHFIKPWYESIDGRFLIWAPQQQTGDAFLELRSWSVLFAGIRGLSLWKKIGFETKKKLVRKSNRFDLIWSLESQIFEWRTRLTFYSAESESILARPGRKLLQ